MHTKNERGSRGTLVFFIVKALWFYSFPTRIFLVAVMLLLFYRIFLKISILNMYIKMCVCLFVHVYECFFF